MSRLNLTAAALAGSTDMTCVVDRCAHLVSAEELEAGLTGGGRGRFWAMCGHVVVAVAMATPPGRPCAKCAELAARSRRQGGRHHRRRVRRA